MKRSKAIIAAGVATIALILIFISPKENSKEESLPAKDAAEENVPPKTVETKYGFPVDDFETRYDTIKPRETIAEVLYGFGFSAQDIHRLVQCPDSIFDERKIRPGQVCALLCAKDSLGTPRYLIFEESAKHYVTFDLGDSCRATRSEIPSVWKEAVVAGRVNSSLWVAMEECNTSPQLAVLMSHIFGWSVDFFGIQKGDEFRLIYAQEYVGEKPLNSYRIEAASFRVADTTIYAIPFKQGEEELFYNSDGNSLEGAFLKAPLDFYRISSKFSNSRYHPVLKRYRAHHGVDYAAPKGTPVYAIGSGKVIAKGYQANGGGNYIKIRHNSTYVTTYMHLAGFAKGIKVGDHVKQKQVIGYVGSTGLSTGPHLDFRVHENGKPINPLTIKSQPKMPINETNKATFTALKDSLVKRLADIPMATPTENTDKERQCSGNISQTR